MPWQVYKDNGNYCVHKKNPDGSKGKKVACHGTDKAKAEAQLRALYAKANSGYAMYSSQSHLNSSNFQTATHAGKEWLIVPGVPVREQVMKNYFVPREEIARSVQGWNGIALSLDHPKLNGGSVNVPDPDVAVIGRFFNASWDNESGRMLGEYWIDVEEAKRYAEGVKILDAIQNGSIIETSTGYFADDDMSAGMFGGRHYDMVHRNLLPDHIAILPEGIRGACSIKDGCGVNRNSEECGEIRNNCSACPLAKNNDTLPAYKDGHLPTALLAPYAFNKGSRSQEQVDKLRAILKSEGKVSKPATITIKNDGHIKIDDGNHRVSIAEELGIEQIPVDLYNEDLESVDPKIIYDKWMHSKDQGYLNSDVHMQESTRRQTALKKIVSKNNKKEKHMTFDELQKLLASKGMSLSVNSDSNGDPSFDLKEREEEAKKKKAVDEEEEDDMPALNAAEIRSLKALAGVAPNLVANSDKFGKLDLILNYADSIEKKQEAARKETIGRIKANSANIYSDEELDTMALPVLEKVEAQMNVNFAPMARAEDLFMNSEVALVPPAPLSNYKRED